MFRVPGGAGGVVCSQFVMYVSFQRQGWGGIKHEKDKFDGEKRRAEEDSRRHA